MTLFIVSFVAGVLTVLSPCVLPLLPVVVGGSLAGGKSLRRALTVVVALGVSVFAFTFLLKVSTIFIMVPQEVWNWVSGGILLIVGLVFLFPHLWDLVPGTAKANRDSTKLMSSGFMRQTFWGDIVVGAALGPVFSTCSPTYFIVLASVLPVSLAAGTADIFAYILGLCLFLFVIALAGQKLLVKLDIAADPNGWLRKALGTLFILIAVLIVTGTLAKVEAPLYNVFDETKLEQKFLPAQSTSAAPMPELSGTTTLGAATSSASAPGFLTLAQKALRYEKAPELVSPDGYLNTGGQAINLAQYRGKDVVLVDFWTYSCINCQRTLPYLTAWYAKYKDQGLVIIGVHTPEFAFEHVESNVAAALKQFGITYPVVLDNEYQTWNAYHNEYWPHEYLIDIDGYIVHDHIGEGGYDDTEKAIQAALAERAARMQTGQAVATSTVDIAPPDLSEIQSPETYFGAARNEYLGSGTGGTTGEQTLSLPASAYGNTLYLSGTWNFDSQYATNESAGAEVEYTYDAKNVYIVASASSSPVQVEVMQDGKPIGSAAGADVKNGVLTVSESRLYNIVSNQSAGPHTITLIIKSPGLEAYTLDFG